MKKILIDYNQEVANQKIREYKEQLIYRNKLILEIEEVQRTKFSTPEFDSFLFNPKDYVKNLKIAIMLSFDFPNAGETFNLQSKGITYEFMDKALEKVSNEEFKYGVDNGKLTLLKEEEKRLLKIGEVYTNNEKQYHTTKILQEICNRFNKLVDNGVMTLNLEHLIQKGSSNFLKKKNDKIVINSWRVLQIK